MAGQSDGLLVFASVEFGSTLYSLRKFLQNPGARIMSAPPRIFISSQFTGLQIEREDLLIGLLQKGFHPVCMEAFPASEDVWGTITERIDNCDLFVLIVGSLYGNTIPNAIATSQNIQPGISWTHAEFQYARRKGVPILIFELQMASEIKDENWQRRDAFREDYMKDGRLIPISPLKNKTTLLQSILTSIEDLFLQLADSNKQRAYILKHSDKLILISFCGFKLERELEKALQDRNGKSWESILLIHPNEQLLQYHRRDDDRVPTPKSAFNNFQLATEKISNHSTNWDVRAADGILHFEGVYGDGGTARAGGMVCIRTVFGNNLCPTSVMEREWWIKSFETIKRESKYSGKTLAFGKANLSRERILRLGVNVTVEGVICDAKWRFSKPLGDQMMRTIFLSLVLLHHYDSRNSQRYFYLQKRNDKNTGGDPNYLSLISSKLIDDDFPPESKEYKKLRSKFAADSSDAKLNKMCEQVDKDAWTRRLVSAHKSAALREIKAGLGLDPSLVMTLIHEENPDAGYWIPREVSTDNWQGLSIRLYSLELTTDMREQIDETRPEHGLKPFSRNQLDALYNQGKICPPMQCNDAKKHPLNHFLQLGYEHAIIPIMDRLEMSK
jgi:hypothetical protein